MARTAQNAKVRKLTRVSPGSQRWFLYLTPLSVLKPAARASVESPDLLSISTVAAPSFSRILQRTPIAVQASSKLRAASLPFCVQISNIPTDIKEP